MARGINWRRVYKGQCGRKTRHSSRGKAEAAQRAYEQAFPNKAEGLRVYECLICKGWHLGHRIRRD
jgi:hypothetical protein